MRILAIVLLLACGLLVPDLQCLRGFAAAESGATPGAIPGTPAPTPNPSGQAPSAQPAPVASNPSDEETPQAPPGLKELLATRAAHPDAPFTSNGPIILQFLIMGFTHIIPDGRDHILFMVGLFLLAPRLKPLLIQVTAFTVAHSITLGLCMAHIVNLPAIFVETTIALSIAFVAIENICYRDIKPWRWVVVFCFGLVHGLGFAELLKNLDMPKGTFFPALISFNVGVEIGQLTIISIAALLTVWFWKKPWYRKGIIIPCSLFIAFMGLFWAGQRAFGWWDFSAPRPAIVIDPTHPIGGEPIPGLLFSD